MSVETTCLSCGYHSEDAVHAFFYCPIAVNVWRSSPLPMIRKVFPNELLLADGLVQRSKEYNSDQLAAIVMILWSIWSLRNKCWAEELPDDQVREMTKALALMEEFRPANKDYSKGKEILTRRRLDRWSATPQGVLKVNCDALVHHHGFIGVAFVIRYSTRTVIGSGVNRQLGNMGMKNAEALAIRMALQFSIELELVCCVV